MRFTHLATTLCAATALACSGAAPETEAPEPAGGSVTMWTDSTELFMEHPALIVGQAGRFAIHLTDLTDFAPLRSGTVTLRFQPRDGGQPVVVTQDEPRAPGIFGASPEFTRPGMYDLTLLVRSPQARDSMLIPDLRVYATVAEAPLEESGGDAGISFLKEQQWKVPEFRTAFAREGTLPAVIEAPAQVAPAQGAHAEVTAPVAGVVDAASAMTAPVVGTRVAAGAPLVVLTPLIGESGNAVADARAKLAEAEDEYARAQRLLAAEAVPRRRVHEADIRLRAARETLAGLGGDSGRVVVRAPIAGVVTARTFVPGGRIAAGTPLFTLIDPSRVWLTVNVATADAARVNPNASASFRTEGADRDRETYRLVSVGATVDALTRSVPVAFEVRNPDGRLTVGALARASIRTGTRITGIVLPAAAVVEADGRSLVYVQREGETFERRDVTVLGRDAGRVVVSGAVRAGDRVVTGAAYQVRLASLSTGAPAQGHVH